jgi:cobalt/nickel transport system ATP-binding protein
MTETIISFKDVTFKYPGGRPAVLTDISVDFKRGKRTVLVGPNGAGKSTFLMHMNGILRPSKGQLSLGQIPFDYSRSGLFALRQKVGIVFQDSDTQLFAPTVEEDVSFGPMNSKLPLSIVRERVDYALEACGISHLAKMPVHNLSGGEKKRIALAGVLAMCPDVLVLDEPTAGLDPDGVLALFQALDALVARGVTVIYSTHDMDLAMAWSDFCVLLRRGQIIRCGDPVDVFGDTLLMQTSGLKTPSVIGLSHALGQSGIHFSEQPRTLDDLVAKINTGEKN